MYADPVRIFLRQLSQQAWRCRPAHAASMEAAEMQLMTEAFAPVVRCCAPARQAAVRACYIIL